MTAQKKARAILQQALPSIAFDGWSEACFRQAGVDAGFSEDLATILFPNLPMDAIDIWVSWADELMSQSADSAFESLGTTQKIRRLILDRLQRFSPHREALNRAVVICSLPWNLPRAMQMTAKTVDAMWELAQVRDHDMNWYTRRAILAYVYTATLRHWLREGEDLAAYLDARLDQAARVGRFTHRFKLG